MTRMKPAKRLLALLLTLLLALSMSSVWAEDEAERTAEPTESATEAPVETEDPAQTEAPAETEIPAETEAPAETELPVETEAPAETEAPTESEAPAQSEAPTEASTHTPAPANTPAPTATPIPDGIYTIEVESSASMFRVVACELTVQNGLFTSVITLSGTGYDTLFVGKAADAKSAAQTAIIPFTTDESGRYRYAVPVSALDTPIAIAAHSISKDTWYDRDLTFKSETMALVKPLVKPLGTPSASPAPTATPLADGIYSIDVESSASMFRVVDCALTAQNGLFTAVIALSGTGYDTLFVGEAADAETAAPSALIPFTVDESGRYCYAVPVSALDTPIAIAAHSISKDTWYDRDLTFKSETMALVQPLGTPAPTDTPDPSATQPAATDTPVPTATPKATDTPAPTATPEATATPEPELDGKTSKVDNSTSLKDGTYTPDSFAFSGGSGKVKITCNKVRVSSGKAYATISFNSPNYPYVKASGQKFTGSHTSSASTFEIPVALNKNNRILGMTTAMSSDHEVEYTIYVGLKSSTSSSGSSSGVRRSSGTRRIATADKPDHVAEDSELMEAAEQWSEEYAEITGLTFVSRDDVGEAELFNIYRYEEGYVAIDVLDVGKVLLVPEDAEVPLSAEEEAIIAHPPLMSAYVASDDAMQLIDDAMLMQVVERITVVHDDAEESPWECLTERAEAGELRSAGEATAPDYAALLTASCDFAVLPMEFALLGLNEEELAEEDPEEIQAMRDVLERLQMLGIPSFVDRSFEEESEAGRLAWLKVYGVLFDCEDAANEAYDEALIALDSDEE